MKYNEIILKNNVKVNIFTGNLFRVYIKNKANVEKIKRANSFIECAIFVLMKITFQNRVTKKADWPINNMAKSLGRVYCASSRYVRSDK